MDIKLLKCKCCGGHIDKATLVCNMCGATYILDDDMKPIRVVYNNDVVTLSSTTIVPREAFYVCDGKDVSEITLEEMAKDLARKILPLIEFTYGYEPVRQEYVTYGKLKVANPHTTTGGCKEVRW